MREFKFRAWVTAKRVSITDFFCVHSPEPPFMTEPFSFDAWEGTYFISHRCYIKEMIILQYIGLKDKNGKEIYERDIVKIIGRDKSFYQVVYNSALFVLIDRDNNLYDNGDYYSGKEPFDYPWGEAEVIGNIYENPRLLKGEKNQ